MGMIRTQTYHSEYTDSKVHVANMGPTWVLSSPGGPHVGPMNLIIRVLLQQVQYGWGLLMGWIYTTIKILDALKHRVARGKVEYWSNYDDIMTYKHFQNYRPFVQELEFCTHKILEDIVMHLKFPQKIGIGCIYKITKVCVIIKLAF